MTYHPDVSKRLVFVSPVVVVYEATIYGKMKRIN